MDKGPNENEFDCLNNFGGLVYARFVNCSCRTSLKYCRLHRTKTHRQFGFWFCQANGLLNSDIDLRSGIKKIKATDIE